MAEGVGGIQQVRLLCGPDFGGENPSMAGWLSHSGRTHGPLLPRGKIEKIEKNEKR